MLMFYLQDGPAVEDSQAGNEQAGSPQRAVVAPEGDKIRLSNDAAQTYSENAAAVRELMGIEAKGISTLGVSLFLAAIILALLVRWMVLRVMDRYLKRFTESTETDYDDKVLAALRRIAGMFIMVGGLVLGFSFIALPTEPIDWQAFVWRFLHSLVIISAGFLLYRITEITLHYISTRKQREGASLLDRQLIPLINDIVKVAIVVLVIVSLVQSWGYSAAGILAGVGIGGLAFAFAAQDTVANIFGSFVIYSDRPFAVGDWILIGGVEGTVEEIGIRSTRVRKFDKTVVSVPNKLVTNEVIQNFSEMPKRRIKLYVGLSYDASVEQINAVVDDTRKMLKEHSGINQEFWMVNLTDMSESSLDMLVYCFTTTTDWQKYRAIRQDVLYRIIGICKARKVEIAFPSRTIYHRHVEASPDFNLPPALRGGSDLPPGLERGGPGDLAETMRGESSGLPKELQRGESDASEGEGE